MDSLKKNGVLRRIEGDCNVKFAYKMESRNMALKSSEYALVSGGAESRTSTAS